ncbi:MAG: SCO1664 family protein [Actinobacteria bacterium]|nr:SCO1664 family protein [Actinomycetota bacterium]
MKLDSKEMLTGELRITHRLVDASNATLLGEIEGYGKVIYKPVAGERPLWDFPDGTLAGREVASFLLSEKLGLHLVPETILREGPFGPGMVQRWIEIDADLDLIEFGQSEDSQLRSLALFDAIINNTDRKFGHLLVDSSGRLFGCDHGVTFHREEKLRTVLWQFAGLALTESEQALLDSALANSNEIAKFLSEHVTEVEIEALCSRISKLSDLNAMPMPSEEWPAVPWPPV